METNGFRTEFDGTIPLPLWYGLHTDSSKSDRAVLLVLFEETMGPRWKDSSGWGTDMDLMFWHGVSVDTWGRVSKLMLAGNELAGTSIFVFVVLGTYGRCCSVSQPTLDLFCFSRSSAEVFRQIIVLSQVGRKV